MTRAEIFWLLISKLTMFCIAAEKCSALRFYLPEDTLQVRKVLLGNCLLCSMFVASTAICGYFLCIIRRCFAQHALLDQTILEEWSRMPEGDFKAAPRHLLDELLASQPEDQQKLKDAVAFALKAPKKDENEGICMWRQHCCFHAVLPSSLYALGFGIFAVCAFFRNLRRGANPQNVRRTSKLQKGSRTRRVFSWRVNTVAFTQSFLFHCMF